MINLYLVPTPIGNIQDMTFRSVEVLNSVDYIYSEDTRNTKVLLSHYNIISGDDCVIIFMSDSFFNIIRVLTDEFFAIF